MCGFVGILYNHPQEISDMRKQEMEDITSLIDHRGPDDEGCFMDEHVSFGFRRLSIVDIEGGHQPLSYENERYWIILMGNL
ncbi:hypothetical protein JQK62_21415 [Leptospira santarosai]|nr:hypothetical protein [Leptospira santarosai]